MTNRALSYLMVNTFRLAEKLSETFTAHFPDSRVINDSDNEQKQLNLNICRSRTNGGLEPGQEYNRSKVRWAFKSAGTDEIVPTLLQQGIEHLVSYMSYIFKACLAYVYIPMASRHVRVMFIPKPRKSDYTKGKAYLPISQSSFLFETMERLAERYIRVSVLKDCPFHQNPVHLPNWKIH
jgi:hypothetical protein